MSQCQCLTLKNEQCKLKAKPGERFCWRHLDCKKEVGETNSTTRTSIIHVPLLPLPIPTSTTLKKRVPMINSKYSGSSIVKIPADLAENVAEGITDRINAGEPAKVATTQTLDDLVDELGYEDISELVDLTPQEIDYFISTILLHENKDKLADIVQKKIDEMNIRDPHAELIIKTQELLEELAAKFCRCIKKILNSNMNNTESMAIAICRRGVINGRGLNFPRFSCKTYPNPDDKSKYFDTPIFLPSKDRKKLLSKHPGYQLYLSSVENGDLSNWDKLSKLEKDKYLKEAK